MLDITKEELMQMILTYFTDEVESCPLNAQAFVDVVFSKYQSKDSKREESQSIIIKAVCNELRQREDKLIDEMRCSEYQTERINREDSHPPFLCKENKFEEGFNPDRDLPRFYDPDTGKFY